MQEQNMVIHYLQDSILMRKVFLIIFIMMLKSLIFGGTIAIIATTTGLAIKDGAQAVGEGATKTVVWSIIFIYIFNYIVTSMFFGN